MKYMTFIHSLLTGNLLFVSNTNTFLTKCVYQLIHFALGDLWSTICNYNREIVQCAPKRTKVKETLETYFKRKHNEYNQSTDESP